MSHPADRMTTSPDRKRLSDSAQRRLGSGHVVIAAALGLLVTVVFLWGTIIPLGIPGEWTWNRHPGRIGEALAAPGSVVAVVVGALWLTLAWAGDRRIEHASRPERSAWWLAMVVAGGAWYAAIIELTPFPQGTGRGAWVLFYPGPSGYYTEARGAANRTAYLAGYQSRVERGDDVLHIGTHPPGLVVAYWLLDDLRRRVPGVDRVLNSTMPEDLREWWRLIDEQTRARGSVVPAGDDRLLWFAALTVGCSVALAMIPLSWVVVREYGGRTAWRSAALLPALPALAVFWPKSDVLLMGVSLGVIALWIAAWDRKSAVGAVGTGALCGLAAWCGVNLTLGLLPTLFWMAIWTAVEIVRMPGPISSRARTGGSRLIAPAAGFLGAGAVLTLAAAACYDVNLPAIWLANLRNHAGFYDVYPRSYLGWLLINPWELVLSLGAPIAVCAGVTLCSGARRWTPVVMATVTTAGLLWLTGKNSGEAARLWAFQGGWWLAAAAPVVAGIRYVPSGAATTVDSDSTSSRVWLVLWGLQLATCAATAWKVAGFHMPGQ